MQAGILDLLRRLAAEQGTAVLLITHDMGVVADLADEVAVMREGVIVERGPAEDVLLTPRHRYTQDLLAAVPALPTLSRAVGGGPVTPVTDRQLGRAPWLSCGACRSRTARAVCWAPAANRCTRSAAWT